MKTDTKALRAIHAKATPGPYRTNKHDECHVYYVESESADTGFGQGEIATCYGREDPNDAEAIAASMNAMPALLDEVEALRAALDKADAMAGLLGTNKSVLYEYTQETGRDIRVTVTASYEAVDALSAYREARAKVA